MSRRVAPWLAVAAAGATSCTHDAPIGGVIVSMNVDDTLGNVEPTRLDVAVRAPTEGGKTYSEGTYPIPKQTPLPAKMVIESDGNPNASVEIEVSLWQDTSPIDARKYIIEAIPTDHFATVDILFSVLCTPLVRAAGDTAISTCPDGETCDPSQGRAQCGRDVFVVGSDAAASGPTPAQSIDASEAESPVSEAGSPVMDATVGGDDASPPDASPPCEAGDPRCADAAPDCPLPCLPGNTYCFKGRCVPVPQSCFGTDTPACTSDEVPGGTFDRSYDGVGFADASAPATISGLRIDAYEVTVARFANFVTAVVLGNGLPEAGAGTHTHTNRGMGLRSTGDGGSVYETGWDPAWSASIPTTQADWDANLSSFVSSTWYPKNPLLNASLPINAVTWYEAYAFCIWDGGFLPSEAEWNYAASGGAEQRVYPWGAMDPGTASEYAIYGCYYRGSGPNSCSVTDNIAPVGSAPMGNGKFGQSDLAGSMWEWTLDTFAPYVTPCHDCVALGGSSRVIRGGAYYQIAQYLDASSRTSAVPGTRYAGVGFRCAREP